MAKIAYLILAHHMASHLSRLVKALDSDNATFFIHIDGNARIEPFRDAVRGDNIFFIAERLPIYWGEFSIVQGAVNLITAALSRRSNLPDYLCLISGADYPLRPSAYIEDFFSRNSGTEFISTVPLPFEPAGKTLERIQSYQWVTHGSSRVQHRLIHVFNRYVAGRVRRDHRRILGDVKPYAGSQWWALTRDACAHILLSMQQRPDVVRFFKNVPIPDESFFHTILANSPFSSCMARNLTYTRWNADRSHPKFLTLDDISAFSGSGAITTGGIYGAGEVLFARKFNESSSAALDFIDNRLRATPIAA